MPVRSNTRRGELGPFYVARCPRINSVTQFRFPLDGGRQGILFRLDRALARLLDPSALSRVEFDVGLKLRRDVRLGVDGVHRTFIHASHAIDALLRMNNQLTLQLVKARHRAYQDAVGELAPQTFIGNDMRHKLFLLQVHRAYECKVDERREFANPFCGKNGVKSKRAKLGAGRLELEKEKRGNLERRRWKSETACWRSDSF